MNEKLLMKDWNYLYCLKELKNYADSLDIEMNTNDSVDVISTITMSLIMKKLSHEQIANLLKVAYNVGYRDGEKS